MHVDKLGTLQDRIITHLIECPLESENTNHIGKALGISQPTAFKSVQLLEKEKYIQTMQDHLRGKRRLLLTDKGIGVALFSGKDKDKIYTYLRKHAPTSSVLLLMNVIKDKNDIDTLWMRLFIEYMLCQEQKVNESDEKKKVELVAALIAGPRNSFVDVKKLGRLLERDEISRLTKMLRNKAKFTNSIIDGLL